MERIAGIVRFGGGDGVPRAAAELGAALRRHGDGSLAILRSDEAAFLRFSTLSPNHDSPRGVARIGPCRIVADLRIDNRIELAAALGIAQLPPEQDAELVLRAYLHWGETACEHLLGDFAYAIFDERTRSLHLARDETAARIVYYCDSIPDTFVFGSGASVVLACSLVPTDIYRARIADCLVGNLEGYELDSSFFTHIKRLTPGTRLLRRAASQISIKRFESKATMPIAHPSEPHEQFVEVLSVCIRDRLLDGGSVGAMLSGGLDSSTIATLAADVQTDPRQPFPVYSAIDPRSADCAETRAIRAMHATGRFQPFTADCAPAEGHSRRLIAAIESMEEPFDERSMLLHLIFDLAAANGSDALMGGVNADALFGQRLPRLLSRKGVYVRVARALPPRVKAIIRGPLRTFGLGLAAPVNSGLEAEHVMSSSWINPGFADEVDLESRLLGMTSEVNQPWPIHRHPYTIAGIERYGRIASAFGCNALHPFNDLRVICLLRQFPVKTVKRPNKYFLRRAMVAQLPESVRLRADKAHVGWIFRAALRGASGRCGPADTKRVDLVELTEYLDCERLAPASANQGAVGLTVSATAWEARFESLKTLNLWRQRIRAASSSRSVADIVFDQELDHGTVM